MGARLMGVQLTGVQLMGARQMGVQLTGAQLLFGRVGVDVCCGPVDGIKKKSA